MNHTCTRTRTTAREDAEAERIRAIIAPLIDGYGHLPASLEGKIREDERLIVRGPRTIGVPVAIDEGYDPRPPHAFPLRPYSPGDAGVWGPSLRWIRVSTIELDAAVAERRALRATERKALARERMRASRAEARRILDAAGITRRSRRVQSPSAADDLVCRLRSRRDERPVRAHLRLQGWGGASGVDRDWWRARFPVEIDEPNALRASDAMYARWLSADPSAAESFGAAWRAVTGYGPRRPSAAMVAAKLSYVRAALAAARENGWPHGWHRHELPNGATRLVWVLGPAGQMSWHCFLRDLSPSEWSAIPEAGLAWDGLRHQTYARYARAMRPQPAAMTA